ncbi:MAG: Crp/Fnr family transcriptional regulator [Bacteroidota bacterium]
MIKLKHLLVLCRHLTIYTVEKGEVFISKGATKKQLFFVRRGMVRSYHVNDNSEDITFQLFPEYHIFGNLHSVVFDKPSEFYYEAIERTKVYTIDYDHLFDVLLTNPNTSVIHRKFISKRVFHQAFNRVQGFVFLSPEERYQKYVKDFPNVVGRAPDKYIANVLGITPVSLSRIRSRIATKVNGAKVK